MVDMPAQNPQRIVLPPHRERARRPRIVRFREWARRNLFNSRAGTALTIITAAILALIVYGVVYFVFAFAEAKKRVRATVNWIKKQQVFEQFLAELRTKYASQVEVREDNLKRVLTSD